MLEEARWSFACVCRLEEQSSPKSVGEVGGVRNQASIHQTIKHLLFELRNRDFKKKEDDDDGDDDRLYLRF